MLKSRHCSACCRSGEIGRRKGLKIPRAQKACAGSIPASGTRNKQSCLLHTLSTFRDSPQCFLLPQRFPRMVTIPCPTLLRWSRSIRSVECQSCSFDLQRVDAVIQIGFYARMRRWSNRAGSSVSFAAGGWMNCFNLIRSLGLTWIISTATQCS